jgi:hypothetical protein
MNQPFKNAFECYDAIGRWLIEGAPEPWKRITIEFEIEVMDDVCEYCIFYTPKRWWRPREAQFFIDDTNFTDCFYQLARLTSTLEKGFFKRCRFSLMQNGKYTTDFEYAQ